MKIWNLTAIAITTITAISILTITPGAFADSGKTMILANGTQYEIDYQGTNVSVKGVTAHFNSYFNNKLDFDVTSDPVQNGSMSVSMSNEAAETIFCLPSSGIGDIRNDFDFTVSTDKNYGEEFAQSTNMKGITLTFNVPANSSRVTFYHMFVGMGVADPLQFSGIPDFATYHQGEQINITAIAQDGCNRRLPASDITIHAGIPSINDISTQTDGIGLFHANFTIPKDTPSQRYKMEIDGTWGNMTGKFFSTLLVQEDNETNTPYRLEDPRLGAFVIPYHLDGGEISNIGVDPSSNLLGIDYYASHSGTLEIRIPQDLMAFVGTKNDTTTMYSGLRDSIPLVEHLDSQGNRVFDLPVTEGRDNVIMIEGIHYGRDLAYDKQGVYVFKINNTLYPVPYNITNGVLDITPDIADKALKLSLYTNMDSGHLRLMLPRTIIDSSRYGVDQDFIVKDLLKNGSMTQQAYEESQTTNNTRVLEIDFGKGQTNTYVYGTYMVPEFPFAVPILLISITALVIFYRTRVTW